MARCRVRDNMGWKRITRANRTIRQNRPTWRKVRELKQSIKKVGRKRKIHKEFRWKKTGWVKV